LGRAYAEAGRGADAEAAFARAFQFNPGEPEALAGRGALRLMRGDAAGAVEDLRSALGGVAAPPADLRIAFARAALAAGEPDEALIQLEAVRGSRAAPPEVEILALRALVDAGQYQQAIAVSGALLAVEPPPEGDPATAAEEGGPTPTQSTTLGPSAPALTPAQISTVQTARARALYELGSLPPARAAAEAALAAEETGTAHYVHALILADLGETAQAIRELQWVLTWDEVFGYPFAEEAAMRLAELERLPTPEPEGG
jgi:tetratricopeptide (TPR) repeat protein